MTTIKTENGNYWKKEGNAAWFLTDPTENYLRLPAKDRLKQMDAELTAAYDADAREYYAQNPSNDMMAQMLMMPFGAPSPRWDAVKAAYGTDYLAARAYDDFQVACADSADQIGGW